MFSSHQSHSTHQPTMASSKSQHRQKTNSVLTNCSIFITGILSVFVVIWGFSSFVFSDNPFSSLSIFPSTTQKIVTATGNGSDVAKAKPVLTFYDDPNLSYSMEKTMRNWDEKRKQWLDLNQHATVANRVQDRILMVTGSQSHPCKSHMGDYLLLRLFKNKVDYSRIHGYDIFYNNAWLEPKMWGVWAKVPLVRAAMVAHPEAEWIWWLDADIAITDMEFRIPLERYGNYNFVVNGWANLLYEHKSWHSINTGSFLIRNCQWSMGFLDAWARMGPQTANYTKWSQIHRSIFKDLGWNANEQTALCYMMLKEKEQWMNKIYLETEYSLHGYWKFIIGKFENITNKHAEIEKEAKELRRRHAEKDGKRYDTMREKYLKEAVGYDTWNWRRPFVTHFTGCMLSTGDLDSNYPGGCLYEIERALNFADNQVLRNFGYMRHDPLDPKSDLISPVPFDYPA